MPHIHMITGSAVLLLNLAAGLWGLCCLVLRKPSRSFWVLARAGQAALILQQLLGGTLGVLGHQPASDLHLLYGVLPMVVVFVAEQLRVGVTKTVLAGRGLVSAQDVGELAPVAQEEVVNSILLRELGIITFAALIVAALAFRAAATAGAL